MDVTRLPLIGRVAAGIVSFSEVRVGIAKWGEYYNIQRLHSAIGGQTPVEAH
jgi:hypothetical protein